MLIGNYEQILKLLSESSGLPLEEIERKIEAKRAKLSGLISREGAAQIIASELGINFEKQKLKVSNLLTGMKKVNLIGKIIKINRIVEYSKNGKSGKIGSFILADETSSIRTVLWDTNHITLIETGNIKEGDTIEVSGGDIRNSELHLSAFADIRSSTAIINNLNIKPVLQKKNLDKIQPNENISTRAFIVQIFGPTFYTVCPECNKRLSEESKCEAHGLVSPKKNAILTLVLDDGTSNLRAVLFNEQIKKIASPEEYENSETFMAKRQELIGSEMIFEGSVRRNRLSEALEIFINEAHPINLDELLSELEKSH